MIYCCCSVAKSCPTPCNPMNCHMPGFPVLHCLSELAQIHAHWVNDAINHLILCHPLLLPSIFPSIRVFSNKLALCSRWPEYGTFINTFTLNKLLPWKCLAQSENIKVGVFPPSLSAHHNEPSALHRQRSCKSTPQGPLCISHKEFVCQQGRCLPKDRVLPGRSTAIRGLSEG